MSSLLAAAETGCLVNAAALCAAAAAETRSRDARSAREIAFALVAAAALAALRRAAPQDDEDAPVSALTCAAAVLAADAAHWLVHRALHASAFRALHCAHHATDGRLRLADAVRVHPVEALAINAALYGLPWAAGVRGQRLQLWAALNTAAACAAHSGATARWGHGAVMDASLHQKHHDAWRVNYGNILSAWDRAAGTFAPA